MKDKKQPKNGFLGLKIEPTVLADYRKLPFSLRKQVSESLREKIYFAVNTYKQSASQNVSEKKQIV